MGRGQRVGVLLGLLAAPCAARAADAERWPQWRGPEGQGVSDDPRLPVEWSATRNVLWKTPVPGRGHSSPVVWGDRIFLTTAVEGEVVPGAQAVKHYEEGKEFLHPDSVGADRRHEFKVLALDAATGKVLWERTAWSGTPYDNRHKRSSYAAPTPATDGRLVFAWFGSEGLHAYDFDGKLAWSRSFGGVPTFGMGVGTSPVLYRDLVIVQVDENTGEKSFIVALDKATGKEAWRTPRKVQASWATPLLVRAGDRDELVTSGNEWVIAYDPADGRERWRTKGVESNAIPSPVAGEGLVVISAGFPAKIAMAIRPGGSGDITGTDRIVWKLAKGTAYVPSPILYQGHVYLMSDKGLLTCVDVKTGEVKYEGGRVPVPATFMASPLAWRGRIFLFSDEGDAFAVKAGPVHEVLATNPLGEPVHATPAVAGGRLYVRAAGHLYAIGASAGS